MRAQNVGAGDMESEQGGTPGGVGSRSGRKERIWGSQGVGKFGKGWIRRRLWELLVERELEKRLPMTVDNGEQKRRVYQRMEGVGRGSAICKHVLHGDCMS